MQRATIPAIASNHEILQLNVSFVEEPTRPIIKVVNIITAS